MCGQQKLRSACTYTQSDQSLCLSLEFSMTVKLLTEHHLEFLRLKEAVQACLSLHMSKCHIVGNHMSQLKCADQLPECPHSLNSVFVVSSLESIIA